jgi:hypothetical protein
LASTHSKKKSIIALSTPRRRNKGEKMEKEEIEARVKNLILLALQSLEKARNLDFQIGERNFESKIWYSFMYVEASIALVKAANNKDYPKAQYNVRALIQKEPSSLLLDAYRSVAKSVTLFSSGGIDSCISELRNARNNLRAFLIASRKKRIDSREAKFVR